MLPLSSARMRSGPNDTSSPERCGPTADSNSAEIMGDGRAWSTFAAGIGRSTGCPGPPPGCDDCPAACCFASSLSKIMSNMTFSRSVICPRGFAPSVMLASSRMPASNGERKEWAL
ncbi:hypothetical protein ABW21_db0209114 [Orbilia brochopaga]|nr:hypothetical protein ABW21_db0209114 [Drechslerella brochopaga]